MHKVYIDTNSMSWMPVSPLAIHGIIMESIQDKSFYALFLTFKASL